MNFNWQAFGSTLFLLIGIFGCIVSMGFVAVEDQPLFWVGLIPSVICLATGFAFMP